MAKTFIVSDPFNGFQKVFDQSKFARYVDFDLIESTYTGAGLKSSNQDAWRRRRLGVWGVVVLRLSSTVGPRRVSLSKTISQSFISVIIGNIVRSAVDLLSSAATAPFSGPDSISFIFVVLARDISSLLIVSA